MFSRSTFHINIITSCFFFIYLTETETFLDEHCYTYIHTHMTMYVSLLQKARNAEIERRELGKGLSKLKQMKLEQEAKETREALRKDKEETRLAREKVKEQIARDRSV